MSIAITTWPVNFGTVHYFGNNPNHLTFGDCGSVWIYLRDVPKDLRDSSKSDVANLGLYVWFSKEGKYIIEPKMRDVHSADLRTVEGMVKTLRKVTKQTEGLTNKFLEGDIEQHLMAVMKALRIKYAFEYGKTNKLANVEPAIKEIARSIEDIKRRHFL